MTDCYSIQELLHQKPPHLWVDEILEVSLSSMTTKVSVSESHPVIASHFPGAPVVPGSILQEMCTQTAACLLTALHVTEEDKKEKAIGVLTRIHDGKFKGFVRPPQTCLIQVDLFSRALEAFRFKASVKIEDIHIVAKFHFTLANLDLGAMHPEASNHQK